MEQLKDKGAVIEAIREDIDVVGVRIQKTKGDGPMKKEQLKGGE